MEAIENKDRFRDDNGITWVWIQATQPLASPPWLHNIYRSGEYPAALPSDPPPFQIFRVDSGWGIRERVYIRATALTALANARKRSVSDAKRLEAGELMNRVKKRAPWITYSWLSRYSRRPHPVLEYLRPGSPERWMLDVRPSDRLRAGPLAKAYLVSDVAAIIRFEDQQRKLVEKSYTRDEASDRLKLKSRIRTPEDLRFGEASEINLYGFSIRVRCELWHDSKHRWQAIHLLSRDDVDTARQWKIDTKHGTKLDHTEAGRVYLPERILLNRINRSAVEPVTHGWLKTASDAGHIARISMPSNHQKNPHGSSLYFYDWEQAVAHYKLTMAAMGQHPRNNSGVFAPYCRPRNHAGIDSETRSLIHQHLPAIRKTVTATDTKVDTIVVNGVVRPKPANMPRTPNKGGRPRHDAAQAELYRTIADDWFKAKANGANQKDFGNQTADISGKFLGKKGLRRVLQWVKDNPVRKPTVNTI